MPPPLLQFHSLQFCVLRSVANCSFSLGHQLSIYPSYLQYCYVSYPFPSVQTTVIRSINSRYSISLCSYRKHMLHEDLINSSIISILPIYSMFHKASNSCKWALPPSPAYRNSADFLTLQYQSLQISSSPSLCSYPSPLFVFDQRWVFHPCLSLFSTLSRTVWPAK